MFTVVSCLGSISSFSSSSFILRCKMPRLSGRTASSSRAVHQDMSHRAVLQRAERASGLSERQYMYLLQIMARPESQQPWTVTLPGERMQRPLDAILTAAVKRHSEAMGHDLLAPPVRPRGSVGQSTRPESRGRGAAPPAKARSERSPPVVLSPAPAAEDKNKGRRDRDEHRRQMKAVAAAFPDGIIPDGFDVSIRAEPRAFNLVVASGSSAAEHQATGDGFVYEDRGLSQSVRVFKAKSGKMMPAVCRWFSAGTCGQAECPYMHLAIPGGTLQRLAATPVFSPASDSEDGTAAEEKRVADRPADDSLVVCDPQPMAVEDKEVETKTEEGKKPNELPKIDFKKGFERKTWALEMEDTPRDVPESLQASSVVPDSAAPKRKAGKPDGAEEPSAKKRDAFQ